MATKTIVAKATLHVPAATFKPFDFTDSGVRKGGNYDVTAAAPGTPVALDEAEADRLIALKIAEPYKAPSTTATPDAIGAPKTPGR